MAKGDFTAEQGIPIEEHEMWTFYEGTREELIAEGVCSAEDFPAPPKRVANFPPQKPDTLRATGPDRSFALYMASARIDFPIVFSYAPTD